MTEEELWDALLGLMAYDLGATDSGIHDENLRARVKAELVRLDTEAEARARARREAGDWSATEMGANLTLSRLVRERMLDEESLAQGYSIEEVKEFLEWLANEMDYAI